MSTKYLLPCECGVKTPIETGQAGQSISCACGRVLSVPTMREIVRLDRAEPDKKAETKVRWSPLQGLVFAGGLITTILALLAAVYFGMIWSSVPPAKPHEDHFDLRAKSDEHLDKIPVDELYEFWCNTIEKEGLGEWQPPLHVQYRELARIFFQRTWIALAAAALGVGATISSFFLRSRRQPA